MIRVVRAFFFLPGELKALLILIREEMFPVNIVLLMAAQHLRPEG